MKSYQNYRLGGLVVRSPFPLTVPDLSGLPPDVEVTEDNVPVALKDVRLRGPRFEAGSNGFLYFPEPDCRLLVEDGKSVTVEVDAEFSPGLLSIFFEQAILAALLHQRGILPLHASAVRKEGKAHLFLGKSRSGKSSAAALLALQGCEPICDDVCAVDALNSQGHCNLLGSSGYLKVPGELSHRFSSHSLQQLNDPERKRVRVVTDSASPAATQICQLTVLEASASGCSKYTRLTSQQALEELVRHTYRPRLVEGLNVRSSHWKQCCAMVASLNVDKLVYLVGLRG